MENKIENKTEEINDSKFQPRSPSESPPSLPQDEKTEKISAKNPKKEFEAMVEFYLADNPHAHRGKVGELEIRFGTNPKTGKPLSKIDTIIKFS